MEGEDMIGEGMSWVSRMGDCGRWRKDDEQEWRSLM